MTYDQIKGTGLANTCTRAVGEGSIKVGNGYKIDNLCIEPTSFQVEEEKITKTGEVTKVFTPAKLTTRQTYTLTGMSGPVSVDGGSFVFKEQDGIDYAATTV